MIDNGKCSAMTPGITYIEKTSGGAFDVEVFMEYHSIQYVRECMTLRPSEVCWNTRINGETRRVNSKDISHGSDFSQALAASIPIHPELPVSTFELMPLIEPPHEAAEFELPSKPPDKTVDFELPAKPPRRFSQAQASQGTPRPWFDQAAHHRARQAVSRLIRAKATNRNPPRTFIDRRARGNKQCHSNKYPTCTHFSYLYFSDQASD